MKFLIDAMFPPRVVQLLNEGGHDAVSPADIGAHNLPDDVLIEVASTEQRVIVTENAGDFAHVTTCTVLLVRKSWWPRDALATRLADSLSRWAIATPTLGPWVLWLEAELR
jgi:hypothetical protein